MAYVAYVTTLKNVRKHSNADRLQLGDCFGNTVCVNLDYSENQIGVYFPTDGQLSVEFAEFNNLLRKKDEAGNNIGGYMDPDKRNVTSIRLRGEKSDGLFLPLSCLDYCFDDGAAAHLHIGDTIDVVNGHEICCKYIPRSNKSVNRTANGNRTRKHKEPVAPLFAEHADTEQLAYNLNAFKPGDEIEITLKMHGTSQRTGYLPVLKGYKRTLWDKILRRDGKPVYDWGYVSGTRRVVLEDFDGGFYGSNAFREQHSKIFEGKLNKGEEIFYEVVGFTDTGVPIMSNGDNRKLNDKDFVKQYGDTTVFSYGCEPEGSTLWMPDGKGDMSLVGRIKQSDIYVYRMTMTNEDGFVVEYTPDFMRYRCEQMGVKTVPVFAKATIDCEGALVYSPNEELYGFVHETENVGETVREIAEKYYDGPDPVGKTHVREGVVVRIINRSKFCAYKHKNFSFKCLEGIVKANADAPDMEEAQEGTDET